MADPNDFFYIEPPVVKAPSVVSAKVEKKIDKKVEPVKVESNKVTEKIIVWRKVDRDGNVSVAWADKDTIHPLALHNFDKYKEFYWHLQKNNL